MTGARDRAALGRGAAILSALAETARPPIRYGEVLHPAGGWTWDDVLVASDWPVAVPEALPDLICCVAAAGFARDWQAMLDGAALRQRVEAVGARVVEAALEADPLCLPDPVGAPDADVDPVAFLEVGRALLRAALPSAPETSEISAAQARLAFDAGLRLFKIMGADHA